MPPDLNVFTGALGQLMERLSVASFTMRAADGTKAELRVERGRPAADAVDVTPAKRS